MHNLKFNLGTDSLALGRKPKVSILKEFQRLKAINDDMFEHNGKVLCDTCAQRVNAKGMWAHKTWCPGIEKKKERERVGGKLILSQKQKETIRQRYFYEGASVPDIMKEMKLSRYTLYHQIRMIRKKIK